MPLLGVHLSRALLRSRVIGQGLIHAKPEGIILIRRADKSKNQRYCDNLDASF